MSETSKTEADLTPFETGVPRTADGDEKQNQWGISHGILSRIGLLFVSLCVIKLAMLVGFRKYLFETHWRTAAQRFDWVTEVAFYLFAVIVGLHLWVFANRCMAAGVRAVRGANACMLTLGATFIFLTFHEGNWNYLSPVMNGILSWKDLGSYLSLNFFFRAPFLAAWISLYALAYYVLARTGKELQILRVTAACAAVYLALYLDGLKASRGALVIADCIGIACLLASRGNRRALGWGWIVLVLSGVFFSFGMFYGLDAKLTISRSSPLFVLLTGIVFALMGGSTLIAWKRGFLKPWSWLLPFGLAAFWLLVNMNYGASENYNKLLCAGLTWPRYFLGEFLIAGSLLAVALVYRRWRPAGSLWWLDGISLGLIAWTLADWKLSRIMGVRLDWPALSLAMGETPRMIWRMARPYLATLGGVLVAASALYVYLSRAAGRTKLARRVREQRQSFAGPGFFVVAFLLLGLAGGFLLAHDKVKDQSLVLLARTSPMWKSVVTPPMDRGSFLENAQALGMNQLVKPEPLPARPKRDLNVVLILLESTYNKHLSLFSGTEDTQPLLKKYKDRMEVFPNFFSSFASSIHARFATFTGLYPVADYQEFTSRRVKVRSIFEVLHDHDYTCSMFYSSFFDYTSFRDFLKARGLDEQYDAETMPGTRKTKPVSWGLREEETLGAIQARIRTYAARDQKFFLTYVPAAPHYPFDGVPQRFSKYRRIKVNDLTPFYLNELLYMDWVTCSILDQLKDSGLLDSTLVIITGDHGEMLGADGEPIGHGWAVTPELANVPLIIMDPGNPGYRLNYRVGSQVDLLPTTLDLLGIGLPENELCQGNSLYSPAAQGERTIFLNSYRQFAILKGEQLTVGDRGTAVETVYAIRNEGPRTLFTEVSTPAGESFSVLRFDKFQANLLRNYAEYARVERETARAGSDANETGGRK